VLVGAALVVLIGAIGFVIHLATEPTAAERAAAEAAAARAALLRHERADVAAATRLVAPPVPRATGAPAPTETSALFTTALPAHEVVGFVPYWELGELGAADYADASTLCYFGPTLTASASYAETDPDWNSTAFSAFVADAHADDDRVLLTVSTTDDSVIDSVLRSPMTSAADLAADLASTLAQRDLDGVDLDIEGTQTSEREPYVTFVRAFAADLRADRPGAELIVDTYVSAAGSSSSFFDVGALGKIADRLFVMGYDMEDPDYSSANAPLISPDLGLSDVQALIAYTRSVAPAKLILGMPFYGYQFTTNGSHAGATVMGDPEAVVYSSIAAEAVPARWDAPTETPYTVQKAGKDVRQIWFDNPVSIALKTALAHVFHLAGVGAWAFGMEGGDASMLDALTGGVAPSR
jgi:hypothetical protein